jgi:hypothetical protein
MKYFKKIILCIILLALCYMVLYYISKKIDGMCNLNYNNSKYDSYNFEKYYGRNSYKNGYSDKYYQYPVFFDKNYKNFTSSKYNYNDVYDAEYKNTNQQPSLHQLKHQF